MTAPYFTRGLFGFLDDHDAGGPIDVGDRSCQLGVLMILNRYVTLGMNIEGEIVEALPVAALRRRILRIVQVVLYDHIIQPVNCAVAIGAYSLLFYIGLK
jgi:hypothetical protein